MNNLKIKKNDTVVVLSGKDKGKQGKVLGTVPSEGKVVVEGVQHGHLPHQAPPSGRGGRHRQARGRHLRQQGAGGLPQVRQGHPRGPQESEGRQEESASASKCGAEL